MQGLVPDAPVLYCGTFSKTMFPGLRIGFVRHFHETDQPADPEMAAALEAAARLMSKEGAKVVDVTLPSLTEFAGVNRAILMSEAGDQLLGGARVRSFVSPFECAPRETLFSAERRLKTDTDTDTGTGTDEGAR